jgi:hypothetical protein
MIVLATVLLRERRKARRPWGSSPCSSGSGSHRPAAARSPAGERIANTAHLTMPTVERSSTGRHSGS